MASPQSERLAITPTPISRVLRTPLSDEVIWKRLREAGFDEESIKRRDKTTLIAYIAKIEAEVCQIRFLVSLFVCFFLLLLLLLLLLQLIDDYVIIEHGHMIKLYF